MIDLQNALSSPTIEHGDPSESIGCRALQHHEEEALPTTLLLLVASPHFSSYPAGSSHESTYEEPQYGASSLDHSFVSLFCHWVGLGDHEL